VSDTLLLMGNEAIGLGLVRFGCDVATAYPGTPSTEVLGAVVRFSRRLQREVYAEWSVNEKAAVETAVAAAWAGRRAAAVMKQVGLNVASDPVLSAAYAGVRGGLVLVVADDPGPHSSQTEQDTRLFGLFAKVPVLDPATPEEAHDLVAEAFALSERHQVPVILRTTTRIAHGRAGVPLLPPDAPPRVDETASLPKDPGRWAATPRHRYVLHTRLVEKLEAVTADHAASRFNRRLGPASGPLGIVAGGHAFAVVEDLLDLLGVADRVPRVQVATPFPLPPGLVGGLLEEVETLLVVEDADAAIELQLPDRRRVRGRRDGTVPAAGELTPETVRGFLEPALVAAGIEPRALPPAPLASLGEAHSPAPRVPTLCPGCGHRTAFYALRRAFPKSTIFTGDIGCYTLGISLGSVDTVLNMGASVTMASGFWRARRQAGSDAPVVGTIGDSTFLHAGVPGLINAVYVGARFVLFILDNGTVAMTGMQPTPATGVLADGSAGTPVSIRALVEACGVRSVQEVDAYDVAGLRKAAKAALAHTRAEDGGPAVVIASRPCLVAQRGVPADEKVRVEVGERCNGCNLCLDRFQCPAILAGREEGDPVVIDRMLCTDCGACIQACARGGLLAAEEASL